MKVNFVVHGADANELREQARSHLYALDPEAEWVVNIDARLGEGDLWHGEVNAHDKTDRRE